MDTAVPSTDGWDKPRLVNLGELRFPKKGVYHVILKPANPKDWTAVNV